jgi:hypothetical protein
VQEEADKEQEALRLAESTKKELERLEKQVGEAKQSYESTRKTLKAI